MSALIINPTIFVWSLVGWTIAGAVAVWMYCTAKARAVRRFDRRMRSVAETIDAGLPCPCCHAEWFEHSDEVVSIKDREVLVRSTWHMDHDDWCDYAEWAGL